METEDQPIPAEIVERLTDLVAHVFDAIAASDEPIEAEPLHGRYAFPD